ncbi:NUDIX hydrolase [Pseudotabrizicola sediminis]|uniref:NUDIX hydrolase n=1 Tax=Pseudotabrizicola sediminis TaxID=2486418 RepID=A0ABY2KNA7_9RHOB|nr:NUDIX hydrolase [Pseudotabrizicola sediminis]TGD42258.1 NUDIX hydrolase [Pseudotabrizicola sediminis]
MFREQVEVAPGHVIPELRDFAVIVPVLPDGRVLTMTGYRHGPRRDCLGFPVGFLDTGETPKVAALRELAEEAGLVPARLIALRDFVDNGNQRGGHGHYFLAAGCEPSPGRLDDAAETAALAALSMRDIAAALDRGAFGVIHQVAGWCLARRHPAFAQA